MSSSVQRGTPAPPRAHALWFAARMEMWPLAARECIVRNPLNGATARLDPNEYALLSSCTGAKALAEHEAEIVAHFDAPAADRPGIRRLLQRSCESRLLVPLDELVARCDAADSAAEERCIVVVRTADRPALLARLLDSGAALERHTGTRRSWHVLDDSRDAASRARNRAVVADHALSCTLHDLDADPMHATLCAAFPDARREIEWLLGTHPGAAASYGRPVNHALLRFAGKRWLALDDDALLDARSCPSPVPGFAVSSANDELLGYEAEAALLDACVPLELDPLSEHERWLGRPVGAAWSMAVRTHGAPAVMLAHEDALRFATPARILFTQNAAVGDPGSSLFPYHVLSLPPASLAHVTAQPSRRNAAFTQRYAWRGMRQFRLAPRRLLTFTTVAGIDNRQLLPPTAPTERNEDLLLGGIAQLGHPEAWFADLPFGLPHRRAAPKRWLAPQASFPQEPLHVVLDALEARAAHLAARAPGHRLAAAAAFLTDLGRAGEGELVERLQAQAIDTATRVIFSIRSQLDDAGVPAAWKDALRPWLASPALSIDGAGLRDRLASPSRVRAICADYGAALAAWPALWEHARQVAA